MLIFKKGNNLLINESNVCTYGLMACAYGSRYYEFLANSSWYLFEIQILRKTLVGTYLFSLLISYSHIEYANSGHYYEKLLTYIDFDLMKLYLELPN